MTNAQFRQRENDQGLKRWEEWQRENSGVGGKKGKWNNKLNERMGSKVIVTSDRKGEVMMFRYPVTIESGINHSGKNGMMAVTI